MPEQPISVPVVTLPLSERIARIVGPTPAPSEREVDKRPELLVAIYLALTEDDPDAGLTALWDLTKLLDLTDQVEFELDTE